ncbi:hypothetical protein OEZ85_003741 [Tetradesmus obliquus]|uniref:Uncharacterized protein n=1 Tax=Tetradesmus obliquus TaxID=3088 RepID=A0ABY8UCV6_TETOB|nr:hypothetical protein OEZ85_003741 [Tetradesmus obliquus]
MKPLPPQHLRAPQLTAPQPTGQKKASAPATREEMAIAAASSSIRDMRPTAGLKREAEEAIVAIACMASSCPQRATCQDVQQPGQSTRNFVTFTRPYGFTTHLSPASHHPHGPDAAAGHSDRADITHKWSTRLLLPSGVWRGELLRQVLPWNWLHVVRV